MTVEPRVPIDDVDERLAWLEDVRLAERLLLANPTLYNVPDGPPRTEREVLRWTTRRFGTVALAVTAAVSIVTGYLLTPYVLDRTAPPPAPASHAVRAVQHPHHAAVVAHAPVRTVPKHAVPRHVVAAHVAAVPHIAPHRVVRPATATVAVPARHRLTAALQAKLRAQDAEIARLRVVAAREEAAARAAQARADAAIRASRARPATEAATTVSTTTAPVDVPAPDPNAGTKAPTNPNGGWTEHPPLPGPYGSIGPVPIGGTIDPCTPHGGRVGVVLNAILQHTNLGASLHF